MDTWSDCPKWLDGLFAFTVFLYPLDWVALSDEWTEIPKFVIQYNKKVEVFLVLAVYSLVT